MRHLEKHLTEWVKYQLITTEQRKAILDHESSVEKKSFVTYGFIALGVLVIGMGVIALVASHWDQITDTVKLIADFILLTCVALFVVYYHDTPYTGKFEGLLFGFLLLVLASIGLIAQIYQLSGDIENSFLFWCAITLPVALFTAKFFTPFFWISILIPASLAKSYDLIYYTFGLDKCVFTMVLTLTPMMTACCSILLRYVRKIAYYWHVSMVFWAMSLGFVMVVTSDVLISSSSICANELYVIPAFTLAAIVLIWIHAARVFTNYQKTILTMMMAVYLLMNHFAFFTEDIPILGAAFSITLFTLLSLYCASANYRYWFHFFTFVIAIRFFFIYLEHFYGLASTGLGLIVAGSLIILLVYGWKRYSRDLLKYMEELSQ